jgi:transposase
MACWFVFITITTLSVSRLLRGVDLRNIHVAGVSFNGRNTVDPRRLLMATDYQSCDNPFIGHRLENLMDSRENFSRGTVDKSSAINQNPIALNHE